MDIHAIIGNTVHCDLSLYLSYLHFFIQRSRNEKGDIIMARTAEITFKDFRRRYNSEDACRAELFRLRFPNGFVCPGNQKHANFLSHCR